VRGTRSGRHVFYITDPAGVLVGLHAYDANLM
jgi:hypothetical protein